MDPIVSAMNGTATHPDSMDRSGPIKFPTGFLPYLLIMLVVFTVLMWAYYVGHLVSRIPGTKNNHALFGALVVILTATFWFPLETWVAILDQTDPNRPHSSFVESLLLGGLTGMVLPIGFGVWILVFLVLQQAFQERQARHSKTKKDEQLEEGGDDDKQLEEGGETEKTASL